MVVSKGRERVTLPKSSSAKRSGDRGDLGETPVLVTAVEGTFHFFATPTLVQVDLVRGGAFFGYHPATQAGGVLMLREFAPTPQVRFHQWHEGLAKANATSAREWVFKVACAEGWWQRLEPHFFSSAPNFKVNYRDETGVFRAYFYTKTGQLRIEGVEAPAYPRKA